LSTPLGAKEQIQLPVSAKTFQQLLLIDAILTFSIADGLKTQPIIVH